MVHAGPLGRYALSAGNSDFRLYELLKNSSRFFRIAEAKTPTDEAVKALASAIYVEWGGGG